MTDASGSQTRDQYLDFTERAQYVMTLAEEEANRFNHNYIGTEHILLGLVREGEGFAATVLGLLGVDLSKIRSAVEFIIGRGSKTISRKLYLTPKSNKVVELARSEARSLSTKIVGTEDLLLGIVLENEGIAAGVLESLGVTVEKVSSVTRRLIRAQQLDSEDGPRQGLEWFSGYHDPLSRMSNFELELLLLEKELGMDPMQKEKDRRQSLREASKAAN